MNKATERQRKRALHTGSKSWRIIREQVLAWEPLCRVCGDPATDADHIDNRPDNNDIDNLQALCASCHSRKTAQQQAGKPWTVQGCDVNGWPLDPNHHWADENHSRKHRQQPTDQGTPPQLTFNANRRIK